MTEEIDLSSLDEAAENGAVRPSRLGPYPPATHFEPMNRDRLQAVIDRFPIVSEAEISVKGADASNYKAIISDGVVVNIPTQRYALIQHQEALKPVIDYLKTRHEAEHVYVSQSANRIRAKLQVMIDHPRYSLQDPTGKKIIFGFSVENSHDGRSTFRLEGGAYRLVCENGVVLPNLIGDIRIKHTQALLHPQKAQEKIKNFVEGIIHTLPTVRDAMLHAKTIPLDADLFEVLMSEYFTKKITRNASDIYSRCKSQNMYTAHVAATDSAIRYPSEIERQKALADFEGFILEPEAVKENAERLLIEIHEGKKAGGRKGA